MRKKIFLFSRCIITFAILFALFKFIPYKNLIELYKDSHKIYIVGGLAIFFLSGFVGVARWRFILLALGFKVSFREAFYAITCGLFFNLFAPSFVAGDVFRGFSITTRHGDAKKVASSVLMDRFSGGIALSMIALIAYIVGHRVINEKEVAVSLAALCGIFGLGSLLIFNKSFFLFFARVFKKNSWIQNKLVSFNNQLYFFRKNPGVFIKALFFSFIIQFFTPLAFFVASKAFDVRVPFVYFLILVPIIMAIAVVPITIAGAGTREAAMVYFFSLIGIDKSISLGISLINLMFMVAGGILGGIIYVSVYHRWLQRNSQNTVT